MRNPLQHFSFDELSSVLRLEDSGRLFWKVRSGPWPAGKEAGFVGSKGYLELRYKKKTLQVHRVVWLLKHGQWPEWMIDHIDGNPANNNPENLRPASNSQNQRNRRNHGAVPFKGVCWNKACQKFQASIKMKYIGLFDTAEEAARAYDRQARLLFKEYAKTNFGEDE